MHSRRGLPSPGKFSVDPKEKDNETFAKGVTAVGRSGRDVRIRCHPEGSPSGRADASVPTQASKLHLVVEALKNQGSFTLKAVYQERQFFRAGLLNQPDFF